ncbi:MFS transporter [Pseudomonas sp. LP_7_YM]|uniref:MFS transporter n=1 Tax=Pseudomonas sp. LP_7_YM TaxID=2485137 RepID=UPI001061CAF4|nr:MFS transporter [Pseudomonas sp. LP_7_YM]TDV72668.1 putative MFS family arabinose efflux permease [Pseudomonas sp. LP_7_YM]
MARTFRSLAVYNFRIWSIGAIVSNIGTWMQRTAQDWLVLTQLTEQNATALGIVMALQFGPMLLLLPLSGVAADHMDRRKLLIGTQLAFAASSLGLGLLTITGHVQLWHVYFFALVSGCVAAIDAPARQTFASDLVDESHLSNAVALNSLSFNAARMIGPAVSGLLIPLVGNGWVFLLNVLAFALMIGSLCSLRTAELHVRERPPRARGQMAEGFRYVWGRPDLKAIMLMLFLVGTFGLNFPIYISTMAVTVFSADAAHYGLLTSLMAVGSVTGALLSARRAHPTPLLILRACTLFGGCFLVAAMMTNFWAFGLLLFVLGISAQTFTTSTNSMVQLSTEPLMRGRVMAILLATTLGGTPVGAPIVGWVADLFGPRWAMAIGAASGLCAALVWFRHLRAAKKAAAA